MISHMSFEPGEDHLPYRKALAGHDFGFGDVKENNMSEDSKRLLAGNDVYVGDNVKFGNKKKNPAKRRKDVRGVEMKKSTVQRTITLAKSKLSMPLKIGNMVLTTEMRLNILRDINTKAMPFRILKKQFGILKDMLKF